MRLKPKHNIKKQRHAVSMALMVTRISIKKSQGRNSVVYVDVGFRLGNIHVSLQYGLNCKKTLHLTSGRPLASQLTVWALILKLDVPNDVQSFVAQLFYSIIESS